jgi:hypothetical protein
VKLFRLLSLALISLSTTAAQAGWFGYENYEDCILGRMKGQNPSMYGTADKPCKREFKIEVDVPKSKVKWHFGGSFSHFEITIESSEEYEIVSGMFSFSEKACGDATKEEDFTEPQKVHFRNQTGLVDDYAIRVDSAKCGLAKELRGRYR